MDLFKTQDEKLPQGSHQVHPQIPASSVGLPAFSYSSNGATLNMYGMAPGYYMPSNQPLPNQNFNQLCYSQYGANPMGFGQTMPNQNSNPQLSQFGVGGSRENPPDKYYTDFRQPALTQNSNLPSSYSRNGFGTNPPGAYPAGSGQTMLNQNSSSQWSQFGQGEFRELPGGKDKKDVCPPLLPTPNPRGAHLDFLQTNTSKSWNPSPAFLTMNPPVGISGSRLIRNESSNSQSSQPSIQKRRPRKRNREPGVESRKVLLPTPSLNPNASVTSGQYGGNRPMPGDLHLGRDCRLFDGSEYGVNHPVVSGSQYGTNHPIPSGSQYGREHPTPSSSQHGGNRPVPDGTTTNLKYPAPDVKNLLFDSSTGYRFDPTTGLHYDANSGFYLNNRLKVLLRWDPITSTYVLVSNNASGLAKPAIAIMSDTRDSRGASAGLPQSQLEELARELARKMLTSGIQEPDLNRDRYQPSLRNSDFHQRIPGSQDPDQYLHPNRYETSLRRDRSPDFYPSNAKRSRWSSPERQIPVGDLRNKLRREPEPRGYYPSSSPEELVERRGDYDTTSVDRHDVRDRVWDERRDRSLSRSRSPQRRSRSPQRRSRSYSSIRDRDASIAEIHEHNLRDVHNLYGRYFSSSVSPSPFILITPVQPKDRLRRSSVIELLEGIISSDKLAFRSVRVYQEGFGAPCNYALVHFYSEDDALYWYKLHRGTVKLGAKFTTFLFFSEDHWVCKKQHSDDKGCDKPTYNFPFRTICFRCLQLRSKFESPISVTDTPSQWIGISQLDCISYSTVTDVISILPRHKGIRIESTEFLREPSGIPIGLCVFQILDKEHATNFFTILKGKFNVRYVLLDKKALDVAPTSSHRSRQERRVTERGLAWQGKWLGLADKDPLAGTSYAKVRSANASLRPREKNVQSAKKRLGSKAGELEGLTPTEKYMEQLPDRKPQRHRIRERRRKKPLLETTSKYIGGELVVIDECRGEEGHVKENKLKLARGKLVRGPINQVIKEQLKNIDLFHSKNSEDPDNILRDLFVDTPALRVFVLLSPVPKDKDLAKKELEKILTSDGFKVQCQDVRVFQGKGLGAPCDYGLVQFYKPVKALSWYNHHKALLHLNDGSNDQFKVFMFFSQNNWTCLHCRFLNFPLRNWCNRCFKNKNQDVSSLISESSAPTRLLGIASSGLPHSVPESSFTAETILATLPEEESKRVISSKMMLEDKGLPGLCVLETQDSKECENLRKHLQSKGWRASFLQMHEPSDSRKLSDSGQASDSGKASDSGNASESNKTSDSDKPSGTEKASELDRSSTAAHSEQKPTAVLNHGDRKYDLLKHIFDNSKQSQYIILSPAPRVKWLTVKQRLHDLLLEDGLNLSCSFDICRPEVYGSSQEYIEVRFTDLESAVSWHGKHNGMVEFVFPETIGRKEITSQMHIYYAGNAWPCRACSALNFPARSLCHKCYAHRDEDGFTPVTISNTPTKWVGISCLRQSIYNVDQVKRVLPPLGGFYVTHMLFIREPNPLLYLGLCVIETPNEKDGESLAEYIKKHPALKYNSETNARVIFVHLNQRSGEESCEQDSEVESRQNDPADALALLWSSVTRDDTFTPNDSANNFHIWWKSLHNGVAEGEDFLKNLFQDQFVVPLPAGDSVFVPLPASQQVMGLQAEQTGQPVGFNRKVYGLLFEKAGVKKEIAEYVKFYAGRCVGGPCTYTILKFDTASEATAWRVRHNGKWVIDLGNGSQWTSFLQFCDPNWKCEKCNNPNFPLRLHCFCCFEPRFGGDPLVTISGTPTRFVGITKFQNWCASEEILFENIKILRKMKDDQQLRQVHYINEQSGISLGLCVLELENAAVARAIFTHLMSLTHRMQNIVYVEISSLES